MNNKCWIIEQGSYSDYRVVGIFSTKENAEQVLAYFKDESSYDVPAICERILDPEVAELNQGLIQYRVRYWRRKGDGEITQVELIKVIEDEDGHWNSGDCYNVWAKDKEHAIKIAAERHAQFQATKAGIA